MGYRGGIKGREKEWNNELRMKCVVGTTNQVDLGKERRQSMKDIMGVWRGVSITWGITSEANWTQPQITNAGDWLVGQERRMNGRRNASWSVIGWVDDIVILWNEQKREYLLCVIHIDYEGVEWRMMEWTCDERFDWRVWIKLKVEWNRKLEEKTVSCYFLNKWRFDTAFQQKMERKSCIK